MTQSMEPIRPSLLILDVLYGMFTPKKQSDTLEVSALPSPSASSYAHSHYQRLFEEAAN